MVFPLYLLLTSLLFFLPIVSPLTTMTTKMTTTTMHKMIPFSSSSAAGRVELFFKTPSELQERVRYLRSCGISSFNIVNKDKKDDMHKWIDSIREVYPEANICAHYSLKYNKVPRKGIDEQRELLLQSLLKDCSDANEILIISGSGGKKEWNTVEALKAVQTYTNNNNNTTATATATVHHRTKIAVAYNPYFPSRPDQEEENCRLTEKLATGCVSKIYLQFGTDLECLRKGLEFIQKEKDKNNNNDDVAIAGSLFLPTKKLIAQQKFRPWNGVFLSPEFLNGGPEQASAIVSEMIRLYKRNNVELLWEAPGIRTEKDMDVVRDLLERTAASTSTAGPDDDDDVIGSSAEKQDDNNDDNFADTENAIATTSRPKKVPASKDDVGDIDDVSVSKRPRRTKVINSRA